MPSPNCHSTTNYTDALGDSGYINESETVQSEKMEEREKVETKESSPECHMVYKYVTHLLARICRRVSANG